ncbi:MAG: hypothetical protein WCR63_02075 [Bacilli bacterium]
MNDIVFLVLTIISFTIILAVFIARLISRDKNRELYFIFELMSYALLISTFVIQMLNSGWNVYSFGILFALLTVMTQVIYRTVFKIIDKHEENK